MALIEVRDLRKRYGNTYALKGVSLSAEGGEITAILGPNASGKSTLLKSILGLVIPDEGHIKVKGYDVRESIHYRRYIGYMPQSPDFPENLTPEDLIRLVSEIRKEEAVDLNRLVDMFQLGKFMGVPIKNLSGGTRQKVNAVIALSFDPEILILDEPTVGMDPLTAKRFKEEIKEKRKKGRCVILTSHIMSEVETVADRVLLLIEGRIVTDETVEEIKTRTGSRDLEEAVSKILTEIGA